MGTNTIPTAVTGTAIPASDHNSLKEAMGNDLVPRNTSGVATADQGDLGSSSLPFKRAAITSGYWMAGDIKPMHTYNGVLTPGQGWMKCDGRVINSTNYDAEHGAGSWVKYVISSLVDGKYLPDITGDKYLSGVSTTAQTGAAPITEVGNASNQIDNSHTHSTPSHNHQWYDRTAGNHSKTYNSGGSAVDIGITNEPVSVKRITTTTTGAGLHPDDSYTSNSGGTTGSAQSATQSIQPRSVEVVYYMRII